MAKMTVAQLREKAVLTLAERKNPNPSEQDIQETRRIMNSYYRLCGLDTQLLYLCNDERTCNTRYTHQKEAQAMRWIDRLNSWLKDYNAHLVYFGYFPTICECGTNNDLYLSHFYD